jgi:hypothetical protein
MPETRQSRTITFVEENTHQKDPQNQILHAKSILDGQILMNQLPLILLQLLNIICHSFKHLCSPHKVRVLNTRLGGPRGDFENADAVRPCCLLAVIAAVQEEEREHSQEAYYAIVSRLFASIETRRKIP